MFVRNTPLNHENLLVDQLLVDIEHAEYPMLEYFLADGRLAQNKIAICQVNMILVLNWKLVF